MGLTSALFTGLSGLNANQFRIDVIGDNIANANTTGFKGSRSMFQTQFAQMFTLGTPPGGTQGGTNGVEVGLGSAIGATQRNMQQGSTETTGLSTDMAVDGNGFFIVRSNDNRQAYTRDGSFLLNANNQLVTADGFFVQGFGVDDNFNIVPGVLTDIRIPLGMASEARATTTVNLSGNLSPAGSIGSQGTRHLSQAFADDGAGTPADAASLMTSLREAGPPVGAPIFAAGDVITLSGATKGGRTLPDAQFTVGAATTLGDYTTWLQQSLGLRSDVVPAGGVSVTAAGAIEIAGNGGEQNTLKISPTDFRLNGTAQPFSFGAVAGFDKAIGQSVYTSFQAYDSLGAPVDVNLTLVLETTATEANTWRFYAESPDDPTGALAVGTGQLTFDKNGRLTGATGLRQITVQRDATGAGDPLNLSLDFSSLSGLNTGKVNSTLMATAQDGFPPGTLNNFSVGSDGSITGTFTNGLTRTLGQVALATFSNSAGLTRETNNVFREGPNSGTAVVTAPSAMGTGRIMTGALELSNVDLSREFIGLINASTGFSAAGKVITTSDKLLNDLLSLTR